MTVGNLYTLEGLEWIIRNVSLNPCYQELIITGLDNNKIVPSIQHLINKSSSCILNDEYKEYEEKFWSYWKNHIWFVNIDELNETLDQFIELDHWIEKPIVIPTPVKTEYSSYDSEKTGFVIRDDNLKRLWKKALLLIKLFGTNVNGTREVMNITSVLTKEPIIDSSMPAHEIIDQYIPQVCDETPTNGLSYTYGSRIHDRKQIDSIVESLTQNIYNRNGVATTWQPPEDYHHPPPCLITVSFRIHPLDEQSFGMYMTTVFRSHDLYAAYCCNLIGLWQLGKKVLQRIRTNTGKDIKFVSLTNLSIAAHVYERDLMKLNDLPMINCSLDKRGYFIISVDKFDKTINVKLMNSNNEQMEEFISDNPHELCDKIQPFISEVSHALYMGRELMRAKWCLEQDIKYVQD